MMTLLHDARYILLQQTCWRPSLQGTDVDGAPMLPVMLLRALVALAAGTWTVVRQRGFWVALAASFIFSRVYQPIGIPPAVRCL